MHAVENWGRPYRRWRSPLGIWIIVISIFLAYSGLHLMSEARGCAARAHGMGIEFSYGLWAGCSYRFGDRFIPEDRLVFLPDGRVLEMTRTRNVAA